MTGKWGTFVRAENLNTTPSKCIWRDDFWSKQTRAVSQPTPAATYFGHHPSFVDLVHRAHLSPEHTTVTKISASVARLSPSSTQNVTFALEHCY